MEADLVLYLDSRPTLEVDQTPKSFSHLAGNVISARLEWHCGEGALDEAVAFDHSKIFTVDQHAGHGEVAHRRVRKHQGELRRGNGPACVIAHPDRQRVTWTYRVYLAAA